MYIKDWSLMECIFSVSQGQWTDSAIDTLSDYLDCDNMYLQVCFCLLYMCCMHKNGGRWGGRCLHLENALIYIVLVGAGTW